MKDYREIGYTVIREADDTYDVNAPGHQAMLLAGITGLLAEIATLLQARNEYKDGESK
jgi:hypothetical protein